jgi:hypothetical protein
MGAENEFRQLKNRKATGYKHIVQHKTWYVKYKGKGDQMVRKEEYI